MANDHSPIPAAGYSPGGGALYEPRGFWDIARIDVAAAAASPVGAEPDVVLLNREHFRNGARWPIVLTRLALCSVGYQLRRFDATPINAATYRNDACNLAEAEVLVTAPQRQQYNKRYLLGRGVQARPTANPSMAFSSVAYASDIWGTSRLAFDRPLVLPNHGAIEVGVGSVIQPGVGLDAGAFPALPARISIEERNGIWGGGARDVERGIRAILDPALMPWGGDGWGVAAGQLGGGLIPAAGWFRAVDYIRQAQATGRAGATVVDAINVAIDQQAWDAQIQASGTAAVAGSPVQPLATQVPCAARTRGGGTGQWWWRPNAPLALMFNELTPALVYDLPEPITLTPGDCLELSVRFPWEAAINAGGELINIGPVYQIGVGLTGFAVIEG